MQAAGLSVFLSTDDDPDSKMSPGERWEHVLYEGLKRCRVLVPLLSTKWLESGWCHAELRIARMQGATIIPVRIEKFERSLLHELQHYKADLEEGDDAPHVIANLISQRLGRRGVRVPAGRIFTGLLPVEVDRAALFEGRDLEIDQLVRDTTAAARSSLPQERVIIITGASGVGKSSLLRAGLMGTLGQPGNWLCIGPVRGRQGVVGLGVDSLAGALGPFGIERPLTAALASNGFADLPLTISGLLDQRQAQACLLGIDQGEELLDGSLEAEQLLAAIARLAAERTLPIAIVLTARDDMAVALQSRLRGGILWPLATMQADQLADALREPLKAAGRYDERAEALIAAMLADVPHDGDAIGPGALPLAAYVMERLEAGGGFTVQAYQAMGRLRGAIGREAEAIWRDRVASQGLADTVQRFFVPGMIKVDPAQGVRLGQNAHVPAAIARPIDLFVERRLLIRSGGSIAPAHETLLREWPRLAGWLDEERERLTALSLLVRDAAAWDNAGRRSDDLLHRGERLRQAKALTEEVDYRGKIDAIASDYIAACTAHEATEEDERFSRAVAVAAGLDTIAALEADRASDSENFVSALRLALAGAVMAYSVIPIDAPRAQCALARAAIHCPARLRIAHHKQQVHSAIFSPDGRRVATISNDNIAHVWDAASGRLITTIAGHKAHLTSVAFSPDGRRIVSGSDDMTAIVRDAETGALMTTLFGHKAYVSSVVFSPDGCRIVTASGDNTARIWDASSGALVTTLFGHGSWVFIAAFSPDGSRIVTASHDKTARIWDADTGALITTLSGHSDRVNSAAFSPDGRRIVTASHDKTARIWDAVSGAQVIPITGHTSGVSCAAFSPDGRHIVTCSADQTARVWDAGSGAQLTEFKGLEGRVRTATFSPDGRRIVTASDDKTARIWDVSSGALLSTLTGHSNRVYSAAFSPDGRRVVTASTDETARIWDVSVLTMPFEELVDYGADSLLVGEHEFTDEEIAATQLPNPPRDPVAAARAMLAKRKAKG